MKNNNYLKRKLISHKKLAQERTILANERNTLAYIRAGFSAFVLGIALIKLFEEHIKYVYAGYITLFVGVILILLGIIYYPLRKKNITLLIYNSNNPPKKTIYMTTLKFFLWHCCTKIQSYEKFKKDFRIPETCSFFHSNF